MFTLYDYYLFIIGNAMTRSVYMSIIGRQGVLVSSGIVVFKDEFISLFLKGLLASLPYLFNL